jgi:hypothetical protein
MLGASGAPPTDASDGCSIGSHLTRPCLSSDRCAASVATDASVGMKITVGNLTTQDMWWPRERQMLDAAFVTW